MKKLSLLLAMLLAGLFSAGAENALHLFTWADYIDPEIVASFEKKHACRLEIDTFDSNEAMYAKIKAGAAGYDVIVPSSYMARVMWNEGMIEELDPAKIPNRRHVDDKYLAKLAIDKEMKYSVPYMVCTSGLAYRKSRVPDFEPTWAMLERPSLKGRVTILNDMRETLGAALRVLGHSLNTTNESHLAQAKEVVLRWKKNIAKFESEQYKAGLASGEFLLVHGYSGDILQAQSEEKDIVYVVPREGTSVACDDLVIPKSAKQKDLAYALINFLTEPANAAVNTAFICYLAPNKPAYDLLEEGLRGNPTLFIPDDLLEKCEVIRDLGEDNAKYIRVWDQIKAE